MIRDSLTDDSAHGYIGQTPGAGTEVLWCPEHGGRTTSQQLDEVAGRADWFELVYDGERVTVSVSKDGDEWLPVDQRTVALSDPFYVGLVVCSVVPRTLCTARFDNVEIAELEIETDDRIECVN